MYGFYGGLQRTANSVKINKKEGKNIPFNPENPCLMETNINPMQTQCSFGQHPAGN